MRSSTEAVSEAELAGLLKADEAAIRFLIALEANRSGKPELGEEIFELLRQSAVNELEDASTEAAFNERLQVYIGYWKRFASGVSSSK